MSQVALTRACLFATALALALFPLLAETFYVQLGAKILIMAVFALSLDLLVGHTGLVSLGHAAYFGLAAYVLALVSPQYAAANLWLALPAAVAAAALAALLIGYLVVRTAGVYFIMVTLAFAQMLYAIFHDSKIAGGSDGIYILVRPELSIAGYKLLDLENPVQFYYFTLADGDFRISLSEPAPARAVRSRARGHTHERGAHAFASAIRSFAISSAPSCSRERLPA